ncbi:MAG: MFS transporter [Proteobacteria bacterium]|nr:MFS transporter [Pseudomonadota bacterium]
MLSVLHNRTYRHLFAAQVVALLGTGLATVALALLAFGLAGDQAGLVLGTALAIKMIAYVGVAPVANAFVDRLPRRRVLVAMDLVRASTVLCLPFVSEVWQVYVLIFVLQSSSAVFTPTFQAAIPDILPDEREYTRALSLSRLAYDLESLLSPAAAVLLLTLMSFHWLFALTALGFLLSAALVLSVIVPQPLGQEEQSDFWERTTKGLRIYLRTPRLQGLLALNLSVAAAGSMVIVNTIILVRSVMDRTEADVGVALAAFGAGSMLVAIALPRVLGNWSERTVMLVGAFWLAACLFAFGAFAQTFGDAGLWLLLLTIWFLLGLGYSAVMTPSGRLLRRSAHPQDRPTIYTAQFALSHACWLVTYPLAGWLGAHMSVSATLLVLAGITAAGAAGGLLVWPASDPQTMNHLHDDLPSDHPHIEGATLTKSGYRHAHVFVIDKQHPRWPSERRT